MIKDDQRTYQRALWNCSDHNSLPWKLIARSIKMHPKRARYLVNKWARQGKILWNNDGTIALTAKATWKPFDLKDFDLLLDLINPAIQEAFEQPSVLMRYARLPKYQKSPARFYY